MANYEAVIGMEVHAELLTESKMFCSCRNAFGGEPNTRCCPVCLGMPGSLPVMNRTAVEHVIRASLALNCTITRNAKFDRKNYFYPDLPKGYQISEYDLPIGRDGYLDIEVEGKTTRVHILRVHLEEDTGKLFHVLGDESEVDYNRSGVPLMEIVTAFPPDMHTAEEARAYLTKLRAILTYIGVTDGKMEEGSLRCEPNLSVRLVGSDTFGTKTEIKNLNSFRAVYKGTQFEVSRQIELLEGGGTVVQETRGWNDTKQATFGQRSKEGEQEYRYFPEPDLVPLSIDDAWIDGIRNSMPELPDAARIRFVESYGIPAYDADVLTQTREMASFYERTVKFGGDPKAASNWMMGEFARLLNATNTEVNDSKITPEKLGGLIKLVAGGTVSGKMAKAIFEKMFETGADGASLAEAEGPQIKDEGALTAIIDSTIAAQTEVWNALLEGDEKKFGFLVGQVMKETKGKGNPQEINRLLKERLDGDRAKA
ncbi:MAG: Asp-tRNA(Asn)/Glu-tRNA(Gln) amidotransferase subunit GatB [Chthonomonadales bacterium]